MVGMFTILGIGLFLADAGPANDEQHRKTGGYYIGLPLHRSRPLRYVVGVLSLVIAAVFLRKLLGA